MRSNKQSFVVRIAEKLIKQLKQGTAPWQKPWRAGNPDHFLPINPTTGNHYRGINTLVLMSEDRTDKRWMTYKQATAMGAQVRKGEQGTAIQYWKTTEQINKLDQYGKPVKDEQGKPIKVTVKLERPKMFMATVFNAEQIDGLPPQEIVMPDWNPSERGEQILNASTVTIKHIERNKAFYRQSTDTIHLPVKAQFSSSDAYYATALHELGHSTGHANRLNRDLSHPFGSEGYAKEELRAEIASMMLGDELKIGHDPEQHVAYVQSWINVLENDPQEIFRAAADAEKIKEFVLALEQKQEIQQDTTLDIATTQQGNEASIPDLASTTTLNFELSQELYKLAGLNKSQIHNLELIAESKRFLQRGSILNDEFSEMTQKRLGFTLPDDWSGKVRVEEKVMLGDSLNVVSVDPTGTDPQLWGVYAFCENNTVQWLVDFTVKHQADQLANQIQLIDAIGDTDMYQTTIKLTKMQEALIRNNPDSTIRLIQAAEAVRKEAEEIAQLATEPGNQPRTYLIVPYAEKDQAKKAGARWDTKAKSWYIHELSDMTEIRQWLPENQSTEQNSTLTPEVEFTEALRSQGCIVPSPQEVKMNGQKQRIQVEGDQGSEKSGFYVAHLDGRPAGYIMNNRTGEEIKWKAKGYSFTTYEKAKLYADAAIKQQERKAIETERHDTIAQSVADLLKTAPFADRDHPYIQEKQIRSENLLQVPQDAAKLPNNSMIKIGQDWNESKQLRKDYPDHIVLTAGDLLIPAQDVNNTTWTVQTINSTGSKMFAAGGKKESHFVVTIGLGSSVDALKDLPAIVISEGYATADTLSQVLQYPTVAAFDSGNLKSVAEQLHQKYPDKAIIIAGDDDIKNKINVGREKAQEAAEAVGGTAIFPTFAPKEQIEKGLSDFNDLANKSVLSKDTVWRQVAPIVAIKVKTIQHTNTQSRSQAKPSSRKAASR